MVLCDNVFCTGETVEFEYITIAGRKFCCVACADDWYQQNEVLAEAATPLRKKSRAAAEASKASAERSLAHLDGPR